MNITSKAWPPEAKSSSISRQTSNAWHTWTGGHMTEIEKLEKYLKEKSYKYERIKETPGTNPWMSGYEKNQIIVYNENGERQWDAICHRGSYGFEQGLLEIMGSIVKPGGDSVEGWLTAEDIIKRLEGKNGINN